MPLARVDNRRQMTFKRRQHAAQIGNDDIGQFGQSHCGGQVLHKLNALGEAVGAGVKIHSGQKFLGLTPNGRGGGVSVQIQDKGSKRVQEFSTRCLIGADGGFSQVAGAAAMNGLRRVPLLQATVELPSGFDPRNVSVWFEPEQTPYFFG